MAEILSPAHRALAAIRGLRQQYEALNNRVAEPIAIVGAACRLPGGADSPEAYWAMLCSGTDAVSEIPTDRWDQNRYYHPDPSIPGKMYARHGGFLDSVAHFDNTLFGVSDEEAADMDPQQRILLELCWEALERAGIAPRTEQSDSDLTGVFVGLATHDYSRAHIDSGDAERIGRNAFTGAAFSIASGRIAYLLGFQGPAMTVDTACSSSLVSVHLACQSLRNGECNTALAGGMNVLADPHRFVYFCKTAALSPSGRCRVFDAEADGYVRAEGGGIVVLKRLSDALADGDNILALIHGSGVNHDGRSNGLTAPNGVSQKRLIRRVLDQASISSGELGYVECHGTGTPLGDPIEVNALGEILAEGRRPSSPNCYLGASKTNFGHLEAAAGVAGLIKTAMVVKHARIPPNLHLQSRNPYIDWDALPVALPRDNTPWPGEREGKRYAAVSAFGFGGTNAHVIVGSPPTPPETSAPTIRVPGLILLSAMDKERLQVHAERLMVYLDSADVTFTEGDIYDRLAYTTQRGRTALAMRLAIVASNVEQLRDALRAYLAGDDHGALYSGRVDGGGDDARLVGGDHEPPLETTLAAQWVRGGNIDWSAIYGDGERPPTLLLPTYPFARRYFWTSLPECDNPLKSQRRAEDGFTAPAPAPEPHTEAKTGDCRSRLITCFARRLDQPFDTVAASTGPAALHIDSIRLVQLRYEIEQVFGVPVSMQLLAANITWDELARAVGMQPVQAATEHDNATEANGGDDSQPFALTDLQEAYLLGRDLSGPAHRVGCHLYVELEARHLDIERLNAAWNRLVSHHPMLRAAMTADGRQRIEPYQPYDIVIHDMRDTEPARLARHIRGTRDALSHRVYGVDDWPLYAIHVTLQPEAGYRIHFSIDELIVDGASVSLLLRQWQTLYRQPDTDLPESRYRFIDHVHDQTQRRNSAKGRDDLEYWLNKCCSLPPAAALPKPGDASAATAARRRLKASLAPDEWSNLQRRARSLDVSPTVLLLTLFCETLGARLDQNSAFTLVLTLFNRLSAQADAESLVGPFATSGLFIDTAAATSLEDRCRQVQQQLWDDLDHGAVGGVTVLRELRRTGQVPSNLVLPVVFTSMIDNFQSTDFNENWSTDWVYAVTQTPQVSLDHQASVRYGALHLSWDIAIGVVDEAQMRTLFNAYHSALATLANDNDAGLDDIRKGLAASLAGPGEEPTGSYPLTDLQSAYLFARLLGDDNAGCVVYQEFRIGSLDVSALENAWHQLIQHHPLLRARISGEGFLVLQRDAPPYSITVEDHRSGNEAGALESIRASMVNRAFRPGEWPLFEVRVSRCQQYWRIHLAVDMLIADAPSLYQLYRDLLAIYYGQPIDRPRQYYAHFLEHVAHTPDRSALSVADDYWNQRFMSLPPGPMLEVPAKANRQRHEKAFEDLAGLQRYARNHKLALQDILFTAYMEVLEKWVAGPLSIVVVDFNRPSSPVGFDGCVGDFTWLSWIGSSDAATPGFAERTRAFARQLEEDRRCCYPVSGLRTLRKHSARHGRHLAFPVVFSRLLNHGAVPLPDGVQWDYGLSRTPQVCLDNVSVERNGALHIHWDAVEDAFAPGVVDRLLNDYIVRLGQLIATHNADIPVGLQTGDAQVAVASRR